MRTYNREALAWAAGVVDGEGHIGRNAKSNTLYIDITQAGSEVPELLTRVRDAVGFGDVRGPFGPYSIKTRQPIWRYNCSRFELVQAFIALVWPWLGAVKRQQATVAMAGFMAYYKPRGVRLRRTHCKKGHLYDGVKYTAQGNFVGNICSICRKAANAQAQRRYRGAQCA